MSEHGLVAALSRRRAPRAVERALEELAADPRVQVVVRGGQRSWSAARYRYSRARTPDEGSTPPLPGD